MELFRHANAVTSLGFPMADATGYALTGLGNLTSTWVAWSDGQPANTAGNPGFQATANTFSEIGTSGVYAGKVAAAELPTASPYVLFLFTGTQTGPGARAAATQYLLIRTASVYANLTGILDATVATPVTAGYLPIDVKQTIGLVTPADNSIEKSLARSYMMATHYVDAAISAVKTKTDFLPSVTAGAAGGVFIAGANAATSITTALTANITGNLSGSVGSVTGAVGSVTAGVTVTTNNDKTGYALSAAGVQAIWDALSTALTTVGSIGKRLVDAIPNAVAGAANGLFIAGTNAATMITTALTTTFTGNLTGSVGSVTGAVGSVTGAVGSVTGNVGGNVTGSVGSVTGAVGSVAAGGIAAASFAAGAIDATAIAANAIGASQLAADGGTEYADAVLGRQIDRNKSGGRTVGQALMALRNRINITSGTLTVYGVDDTTAEWTATVATESVQAIVTDINPA